MVQIKNKKFNKNDVLKFFKDYALVTVGALLMTTSCYFFILPCHMVSGGVAGVSNVLFYWFGWKQSVVSICLQAPLLVLALFKLKKSFAIKTVYSCVVYSLIMRFYETVFPDIPNTKPDSILLWMVMGGVIGGVSIVLPFWAGGSNGGSEIISGIAVSKNPDTQVGKVLMLVNYCVYALALVCFATTEGLTMESIIKIIYSVILSYVESFTIDLLNNGVDPTLKYYIITDKADEISALIFAKFRRGVSCADAVDAKGEKTGKKVLITVIQYRQNNTLKHIIKETDPDCFAYCKLLDGVVTRPNFNKRY